MIGVGGIARQIERCKNRTEKQPGAELARDEVGVLALPAQSRRLRQRLFHHGRGVDEHFYLAARGCNQPSRKRLQPLLDQVVIIVALRIDRDRAARAPLQNRQRVFVGPVIDPQHDDRAHGRPQQARVGAAFRLRGEPVHIAMGAGIEEVAEISSGVRKHIGIGDADAIESQRARFVGERGSQRSGGCI